MWPVRAMPWAVLVVLAVAGMSFAQDPVLTRLYGSGVHAYFAGKYAKAHEFLTKAIDMGFNDPRAYYFRGLAYLKLGRPEEAEDDFRKGAEIEAGDIGLVYDVGRSLERIQGRARLLLERHRFAARMAALERAERIRRERYGEERARQRGFILEQAQPLPSPPPPAAGGATSPSSGPAVIPLPPPLAPTTERGPEPVQPQPPTGAQQESSLPAVGPGGAPTMPQAVEAPGELPQSPPMPQPPAEETEPVPALPPLPPPPEN